MIVWFMSANKVENSHDNLQNGGVNDTRTLTILYKRRPIRDGRQIFEKNKRRGLGFPKNL